MSEIIADDYIALVAAVKARVRAAQYAALRAVNKELVGLYWDIGRLIAERQHENGHGSATVELLSKDLQAEFPGVGGFSARNLWRMRSFYLSHTGKANLPPLVAEIGWSHNVVILESCKDDLEREFYLRMTAKFGWTKNVLIHQIENQTYEKTLLGQTNFEHTLPDASRADESFRFIVQATLAIKDEYTFDFLALADEHSERQLETAILAKIEPFLREMGGLFSFVGSQYRLEVDEEEFFIDLLLYHRRLHCLVAIELKVGEFQPEFVGKMQFYLAALDATAREEGESPAIGIILCKSKRRTIVEYALRDSNRPIGVSTYRVTRSLPAEMAGLLPTPEQVARLLEG